MITYIENKKLPTQEKKEEAKEVEKQTTSTPEANNNIVENLNNQKNTEIIEMDRMRKIISSHMTMSKATSAHITSFVEADMTNIVNWRNSVKEEFKQKEGQNITFTPIIIEAMAKAVKDFPMINVSVDGTNIHVHKLSLIHI